MDKHFAALDHQDWKTVFEHRKTQHDNFIYNNLEFTLQDGS